MKHIFSIIHINRGFMIIHIVRPGETIITIAKLYDFSVERLILDNGLEHDVSLIVGQPIVIAFPEKTYTVQEGDDLQSIADKNNVTLIDMLRNNPFLADREYLIPGESLVISYGNKISNVSTNGYTTTFIN
jgi:spore germination protein